MINKKLKEQESVRSSIEEISRKTQSEVVEKQHEKTPLAATTFESVSSASHDIFKGLMSEVENRKADMLVMGWKGGFSLGRIYKSPVQRIIKNLKADVSVLKDRGLNEINSVVVPWGGGLHARLGMEIGLRIAHDVDAKLRIIRLVKPGTNLEDEEKELRKRIKPLAEDFANLEILVKESTDVTGGILEELEEHQDDLLIIGASNEWGIKNVLFGTIPDIIADNAPSSVLMVRRYVTKDWKLKASQGLKKAKERFGFTSSPEQNI